MRRTFESLRERSGQGFCRAAWCAALVLVVTEGAALAQPRPPAKPRPVPRTVEEPLVPPPDTEKHPEEALTVPGGLTAEKAARRAATTSPGARVAEESIAGASARYDAALLGYVPRIDLTASYTRLSNFTGVSAFGGSGLVVTSAPVGTLNPTPTESAPGPNFNPSIFDYYVMKAAVSIPISDYLLKANKELTAATRSEEAAHFDVLAARAASYQNGKEAYYNWVRARGAQVVAEQSLVVAEAHLKDAKFLFEGGNASSADVFRSETAIAATQLILEKAKAYRTNLDWHVRVVMHAPDDEKLEPGESLDEPLPPAPDDIKALLAEAYAQRPEIKSAQKNLEAAQKLTTVASVKRYPALHGVGDVLYANPNSRKSPLQPVWFPTWEVGAVLTWSPNDVPAGGAAAAEARSKANAIVAQMAVARDGIVKELVEAYTNLRASDAAVASTQRQLDSALGGYRVARSLYIGGRTNSTALLDAETALSQARFAHLDARADARIARVLLDHALGRDARLLDH